MNKDQHRICFNQDAASDVQKDLISTINDLIRLPLPTQTKEVISSPPSRCVDTYIVPQVPTRYRSTRVGPTSLEVSQDAANEAQHCRNTAQSTTIALARLISPSVLKSLGFKGEREEVQNCQRITASGSRVFWTRSGCTTRVCTCLHITPYAGSTLKFLGRFSWPIHN